MSYTVLLNVCFNISVHFFSSSFFFFFNSSEGMVAIRNVLLKSFRSRHKALGHGSFSRTCRSCLE